MGNIRSLKNRFGLRKQPHILRPEKAKRDGRRCVGLSLNGVVKTQRVAWLILLAFVGPRPNKMEVCHRNDNAGDDRLTNLYYGSHWQNIQDCYTNGKKLHAIRGPKPVAKIKILRMKFPQLQNVSRQRLWQVEQKLIGNCIICGKPRNGLPNYCLKHKIKMRKYFRERYLAKRSKK